MCKHIRELGVGQQVGSLLTFTSENVGCFGKYSIILFRKSVNFVENFQCEN